MPPAQLVFLTLFLGLVSGPQPVALQVAGAPAAVEIRLDGRAAAHLSGPPWRAEVDLGPLLPRELTAIARDAHGGELARTSQWLNMPRPPAEAQILLERDAQGRPVGAQVLWQSSTAAPPLAVMVTLDGVPLRTRGISGVPGAAGAGVAVELGASDPATPHVLSAELRFENGVVARRDLAFGGELGDEARTELTAVALRRELPGKTPPPKSAAREWLRGPRGPLAPLAVETGGADVILVRDLSAREAVARYGRGRQGPSRSGMPTLRGGVVVLPAQDTLRFEARLSKGTRLRFLWPTAKFERTGALLSKLFDSSQSFPAEEAGIAWLLTKVEHPLERPERQRFTDAVAIAGVQAAAGGRPRAVVLVLGERPTEDPSFHAPARVRDYLAALRVPLVVWSLGGLEAPAVKAWGGAVDVSSLTKLRRATAALRKELEAQVVVWVEGAYLPQEIELTAAATAAGVSAAGGGRDPGKQ